MSENKLKSKRKWVQNAIAELKPFIERKEHITRSTAGKLLKPVTNWQRREVDTLRKQANQIIRGENVNAMVYTIFGMTLEHPELKPVKEMFDASVKAEREPYVLSGDLKIRGMMPSEHAVFYNEDGSRREVLGGDVWIIRNAGGDTDTLIIENDQTYVLIKDTMKFPPVARGGYRCIYPECVVVAEIKLVEAVQSDEPVDVPLPVQGELVLCTKTYALSKEKQNGDCYQDDDGYLKAWSGKDWINLGRVDLPGPAINGPITLNWVKNIDTLADLPDSPQPGDMVGVYNGRVMEVDVYMVWTPQGAWCELIQNTRTEESIRTAKLKSIAEHFGIKLEEELYAKITQPVKSKHAGPEQLAYYAKYAGVNRAVFIKELPTYGYLREQGVPGEVFDIADQEDIGIATVGWAGDDWVDVTDLTRTVPHIRYRSYNDQPPATLDEHRHTGKVTDQETTAPVKRTNPRYTLIVANEFDTKLLNHKANFSRGDDYLEELNGRNYMWENGRWILYSTIRKMNEDESLHHGTSALTGVDLPTPGVQLAFAPEAARTQAKFSELRHGDAYINGADHVIAWMCNEWTDLGPFHHQLGYIRNADGEVRAKNNRDLLEDKLQCKVHYKGIVRGWGELPEDPAKGDLYTNFDRYGACHYAEVVWDGEAWIDHCYPFKMIALPEYVVETEIERAEETLVRENQGDVTDWRFEEPKPNPNGFWSRVGRALGFK